MGSLLTQLRDAGTVRIGTVSGAAVTFTQRLYNALNNGTPEAFVLTHDAPQEIQDALQEIAGEALFVNDERAKGSDEYRDVKSLLGMIERRNASNPNHGKSTYGNVNIPADGAILDDAGNVVGFTVQAK